MKYFFLLLCWCSLLACSDFQKGKHLKQLDEQRANLLKMEQVIQSNDLQKIRVDLNAAEALDQLIQQHYDNDTLSLPTAKKLDAFKEMLFLLREIVGQHTALLTEIANTKARIEALRLDIETGSGQREKYTEAVTYETQKVAELAKLTDFYRVQLEKARANYMLTYTFVHDFSEQLKKRN